MMYENNNETKREELKTKKLARRLRKNAHNWEKKKKRTIKSSSKAKNLICSESIGACDVGVLMNPQQYLEERKHKKKKPSYAIIWWKILFCQQITEKGSVFLLCIVPFAGLLVYFVFSPFCIDKLITI